MTSENKNDWKSFSNLTLNRENFNVSIVYLKKTRFSSYGGYFNKVLVLTRTSVVRFSLRVELPKRTFSKRFIICANKVSCWRLDAVAKSKYRSISRSAVLCSPDWKSKENSSDFNFVSQTSRMTSKKNFPSSRISRNRLTSQRSTFLTTSSLSDDEN